MNWQKVMKPTIAAFSVLFAAVITAWVNAAMTGTPLNGVPGIIRFWKSVLQGSVPVWLAFVFVVAALAGCALWFLVYKRRMKGRARLSIIVLSTPPPRWHIGAMAQTPYMNVSVHAQLAHTGEYSLKIVKGYLEGTECVAPFMPVMVTGPYDESTMVHFGVRPILAKDGKAITTGQNEFALNRGIIRLRNSVRAEIQFSVGFAERQLHLRNSLMHRRCPLTNLASSNL
jgi:hypothetical protein